MQSKAKRKQSKAKQSKVKQSKVKQSKAKNNRDVENTVNEDRNVFPALLTKQANRKWNPEGLSTSAFPSRWSVVFC